MNNIYQREFDVAVAMYDKVKRDELIRNYNTEIIYECSTCEDIKPLYQFWADSSTKSGLRMKCILCSKEQYAKKKHIVKALYYKYKTKLQLRIEATNKRMIELQKRQLEIITHFNKA